MVPQPGLSGIHHGRDGRQVFHALRIRIDFTLSGVRAGFFCRSRATAPLTTGAAMLVPLNTLVQVSAVVRRGTGLDLRSLLQ